MTLYTHPAPTKGVLQTLLIEVFDRRVQHVTVEKTFQCITLRGQEYSYKGEEFENRA